MRSGPGSATGRDGGFLLAAVPAAEAHDPLTSAPPVGVLISGAHHRGVLSARWLGHGAALLPMRGLVTPVVRQPLSFR